MASKRTGEAKSAPSKWHAFACQSLTHSRNFSCLTCILIPLKARSTYCGSQSRQRAWYTQLIRTLRSLSKCFGEAKMPVDTKTTFQGIKEATGTAPSSPLPCKSLSRKCTKSELFAMLKIRKAPSPRTAEVRLEVSRFTRRWKERPCSHSLSKKCWKPRTAVRGCPGIGIPPTEKVSPVQSFPRFIHWPKTHRKRMWLWTPEHI